MLNKMQIIGRLGQDPETRHLQDGTSVTNISVATTEKWKSKDGSKQEKTEWHKIVFWGRLAEIAGEYLRKGSMAYIEGKLETRKWQDQSGNDRYTTEIKAHELKMLGGNEGGERASSPRQQQNNAGAAGNGGYQPSQDQFQDDIPF